MIHTLETDDDYFLPLGDPRLEATIGRYNPDFVAWDPVRDYVIGDPNSDADMTASVREFGRVSIGCT